MTYDNQGFCKVNMKLVKNIVLIFFIVDEFIEFIGDKLN